MRLTKVNTAHEPSSPLFYTFYTPLYSYSMTAASALKKGIASRIEPTTSTILKIQKVLSPGLELKKSA